MFANLAHHPGPLLVVILLIVLLFGWKRMPDMARSVGRSARILKSEADEFKAESAARRGDPTSSDPQLGEDVDHRAKDPVAGVATHQAPRQTRPLD